MFTSACLEYEKPSLFEHLPSPRKRLLGFNRHSLEELHRYALIRLVEVTLPEHKRPIVLVHVPSLLAYIERVEQLAEAKRLAEIRKGYAHHHVTPNEEQSGERGLDETAQ